ncbi:DMT family transporter [Acinetobacter qingfengensis]|uniref:Transporter n=1 Tax=Acinetobacter qingfengensis TaxID=1262585 RepID=A0A1E7RFQ7_9GAMM|nr:DMT family transporter [Acinetobacter qingfengensis]KAA8732819.1 DMT family transporter [Acinetobacter qingfengensis]OEY98219.1 transporter [Acinetobacter qingfengensis]
MHQKSQGWLNGLLGVIIFAGSLPATRLALRDFNPEFLTGIRAVIAGILSLAIIIIFKQGKPEIKHYASLAIVAFGAVFGFPFFTALALQSITSAQSIVFIGLLPLSTAIFAVIRAKERPQSKFWLFAILGSACIIYFIYLQTQSKNDLLGYFWMICAIVVCGLAYAEGGKLSRTLGGWQVIAWALIFSLPIMLIFTCFYLPKTFHQVTLSGMLSLFYVSVFSMFLGFIFWYKGLAQGGIAAVGQLQLLQPFFGFLLAALFLHETIEWQFIAISMAVLCCVGFAKKYAYAT